MECVGQDGLVSGIACSPAKSARRHWVQGPSQRLAPSFQSLSSPGVGRDQNRKVLNGEAAQEGCGCQPASAAVVPRMPASRPLEPQEAPCFSQAFSQLGRLVAFRFRWPHLSGEERSRLLHSCS